MVISVNSTTITKRQRKIQLHKSCYGCYYEHDENCYWFKLIGGSTQKKIPEDILNKGCSKYENNASIGNQSGDKLTTKLINVFNGEIVGKKYKPPTRTYKPYKKKYVKSAHNYSYRKDAQ